MVVTNFSVVIIMLSGEAVNSIFCITMVIIVKGLPKDPLNGLEYITTGIN